MRSPTVLLASAAACIWCVALCSSPRGALALEPHQAAATCSSSAGDAEDNLQRHTFDLGYGEEVFNFYLTPDVSTFYQEDAGSRRVARPRFNGMSGKFVNMSPEPVKWYWDPGNAPGILMANCPPFSAVGTATFPTHKFYFADDKDPSVILKRFRVADGESIYYYDPFEDPLGDAKTTRRNLEVLTLSEYEKYEKHKRSMLFSKKYREITGRDYLPIYPRNKPIHYLWPADYYGQQHWATTRETHFVELPPEQILPEIT